MAEKQISKPTMEQWAKLYDIAMRIKELAPWRELFDTDIITLELPGMEEPLFCSILGNAGECEGVVVYPGVLGFDSFSRMASMDESTPPSMLFSQQHCLVMYLGDREELYPEDKKVIKELGLKFRGRGQWIYFRSMWPGYYPWFLEQDEAELMIQALQNLYMACGYLLSGDIAVDFDEGETLFRYYSKEDKEWRNGCITLPKYNIKMDELVMEDEMQLARLKNRPKKHAALELDWFYAPTPIQEKRHDRPRFPAMYLLADHASGMLLNHRLPEDGTPIVISMMAGFCDFMMEHYRPSDLYMRDERIANLAGDLCGKLDIKLHAGEGMPAINEAYASMAGYFESTHGTDE